MVRFLNPVGEFKRELKSSHSKMDLKMGDIPILSRVIVADEDIVLESGKSVSIKIKEISIPAKHIVSISGYAVNKYGHSIAVGSENHIPLSMDKTVNKTAFIPFSDGVIEKGDLLGFLSLFPVEIINNLFK